MGQAIDDDLSSILFGSIPKHEDLCYLMGTIMLAENNTPSISNKGYQCQIYKCRFLIFTASEVIASPVLGAVQNIHIIISKTYHFSGKLKPYLEKTNIKVGEPLPLTNAVYESCLRYTILAKLAPSWNQVEKYLVHGRDFLFSPSPLDAVKLDVVINEVDMHIVLWPLRLRLPQVCPQDLQPSSFSSTFPWDLPSSNLTVHVLPSLNKANVIMVTEHIPSNSLFKTYKDLKKHWKNSYGYRLPESEEGILYVTVKFGRWLSESMTYPIMCVRARRPVFLRQLDPQRVLLQVLADVRMKVPTICGYPFGIETSVRYALPKLNILSEVLFPFPSNLSETRPIRKKNQDSEEETSLAFTSTGSNSQPPTPYSQSQFGRLGCEANLRVNRTSPPPFLPKLSQLIRPTQLSPLFVPMFTPKVKQHSQSSSTHMTPRKQEPVTVRPLFGRSPIKPIFGLAQPSPLISTMHTKKPNRHVASKTKNITSFSTPFTESPNLHSFNPSSGEKTLLHVPQAGCKKVRHKPQVQQGVDVKALAEAKDGLAKVNTTTLIAFLRKEGVPCKVKDKKGDLVAKVYSHLKLPMPENPQTPPSPSSSIGKEEN